MTIILLQPDGVSITAQAERQGSAALYGGGANRPLGGRSGFRVGTPSNVLTVTTTAWTLEPCSAMIDPGASTHQGMYGWASDANITGSVTASDATYARKDIVYIQVNDSTAGDGSGATTAPVLYLAGTPSETPAAPALPARSFLVGTIDVPKTGAGSPTVTLNTARFVAAGGVLPVATDAEASALTQSPGLTVSYPDGLTATSNGTSLVERTESVALVAPDAGWSVVGGLVKTRTRGGITHVTIAARVTRNAAPSGGPFSIGASMGSLLAAFIPSGWRPAVVSDMRAVVNDSSATTGQGEPVIRVGTDGTVAARVQWGGATISADAGWTLHIQGTWFL